MYHSRLISSSWCFAAAGSMCASTTQWKLKSQAAYQGDSHLSGMASTSRLSRLHHAEVPPGGPRGGGRRWRRVAGQPAVYVVVVDLLAPAHAGEGPPHHGGLLVARPGGPQRGVELVGLALAQGERALERGAQLEPGRGR